VRGSGSQKPPVGLSQQLPFLSVGRRLLGDRRPGPLVEVNRLSDVDLLSTEGLTRSARAPFHRIIIVTGTRMSLPQFVETERWRGSRHEGGHHMSYYLYGFTPGAIEIDHAKARFSAVIGIPDIKSDRASQIAFREARLRTLVAGFVAQAIPRGDGSKPDDLDFPTEWKPYGQIAQDFRSFEKVVAELVKLDPLPDGTDAIQFHFEKARNQVLADLSQELPALDAIHDALLHAEANVVEPEALAELSAVKEFIARTHQRQAEEA